jgi:hypothetical protein
VAPVGRPPLLRVGHDGVEVGVERVDVELRDGLRVVVAVTEGVRPGCFWWRMLRLRLSGHQFSLPWNLGDVRAPQSGRVNRKLRPQREETSPYLLQHADNPVDWFARACGRGARRRSRRPSAPARVVPIFLSVGYSSCHWCHVMAHESFEDDGDAAVMNEYFVNVKVDREERPDVDAVYMRRPRR